MFTISPIGSCRITTPLKNGQARHGFKLNLSRCYGYCHSPAEAVQLARFMHGATDIPADVWPLVSRSHDLNAIAAHRHETSHLYVVELASAKELTIDGYSIQLNYLRLYFGEFFSDRNRIQEFWTFAQSNDGAEIEDFLKSEWSATEKQRADSAILGRIRLSLVTRESLRRDIHELSRILPEILFVSHVDARKPDGSSIESRSNFINLVKEEVADLGLNIFNPTDLMVEHGQSAAIEDERAGLAHFTQQFGNAMMEEWMQHFVAPLTDRLVRHKQSGGAERLLKPQVRAAISRGEHERSIARLKSLAVDCEVSREILSTATQSWAEANDIFCAATDSIFPESLSDLHISDLVVTAGKLGLFDIALDLAARAPNGFWSLPTHLLVRLAVQSAEAGDTDNAFEFALAAYQQNSALPRAKSLLISIALTHECNLLAALTNEQFDEMLLGLNPSEKVQLLDLTGHSPAEAVSRAWTASEVLEFATYLSGSGHLETAANVLAAWRNAHQYDRIRDGNLVALIDEWVACARVLDQTAQRIRTLAVLTEACPFHRELRGAVRDARVDLVEQIRAAGKDGDLEALEALAIEARPLQGPFPEVDLWRARLKYDRGEFKDVLKLGPIATEYLSERIGVWVLLMRAAQKANDLNKAAQFAGRVIDLACSQTHNLKLEAEAVLNAELLG